MIRYLSPRQRPPALRHLILILGIVGFIDGSQTVRAQDTFPITEGPCACRIRLEQVAVLGSLNGPDAFGENAVMLVDPRSRVLVAGAHAPGVLEAFSTKGVLLRSLSRRGHGPAEMQYVTQMASGVGDTVYILEGYHARISVMLGDSVVAHHRVPAMVYDFVPLGGSAYVVAATVRTRSAAGYPLHLVRDGEIVQSFGGTGDLLGPGGGLPYSRRIARASDGAVWAAPPDAYALEKWSISGEKVLELTRDPAWWLDYGGMVVHAGNAPPASRIRAMEEDQDGRLWVYLLVADGEWRPGTWQITPTGERRSPRAEHDRLYDTVIEVIDPASRRVLVSALSTRKLTPLTGHYLYSYEEDSLGTPRYLIWRVTLQSTGGPK